MSPCPVTLGEAKHALAEALDLAAECAKQYVANSDLRELAAIAKYNTGEAGGGADSAHNLLQMAIRKAAIEAISRSRI